MRFLIKEAYAKKVSEKLSVKDKKLIQLLIQDARTPITQLAKKVGISKSAVIQKISSLKKRGILMEPILYSKIKTHETSFYVFDILTQIGMGNKKITEELLEIEEIVVVLWYNGNYNLLLAFNTNDPSEIIEKIEKVIEIKKLRIRKVIDNWFHPPYLFKEISDKKVEFKRVNLKIDEIDKKILRVLEDNPLASFVEISTKTRLAAQTIKKHLNYLEKSGIIIAYHFFPEVWLCGRNLISINLSVKGKKEIEKLVKYLLTISEVGNIWEFDDEWNINVVLWVKEQLEVNKIINHITSNFKILEYDISVLAAMVGK
jgi:Lrp/AsnC family transcriptional regulator for asnA, asnC and gidA